MQYNKQQLIMKHYTKPNHKDLELNEKNTFTKYSNSCVDQISLKHDWNNELLNIKFNAIGCAICLASTDMLIDAINSKPKTEVLKITNQYQKLINQEISEDESLNELNIFADVKQHLNRFHCANLVAMAIKELLDKCE